MIFTYFKCNYKGAHLQMHSQCRTIGRYCLCTSSSVSHSTDWAHDLDVTVLLCLTVQQHKCTAHLHYLYSSAPQVSSNPVGFIKWGGASCPHLLMVYNWALPAVVLLQYVLKEDYYFCHTHPPGHHGDSQKQLLVAAAEESALDESGHRHTGRWSVWILEVWAGKYRK